MPDVNVVEELQALLELETKPDESAQDFVERLAKKADVLKDDDWATLSEETQSWVNSAIEAISTKTDIPLPVGLDTVAGLAVNAPAEEAPEAAEAAPAKKGKAKPKKEPKTAKPKAKVKASTTGATRGPKGKFALTDKIKLLKKENPFRLGTKCFGWYALYTNGMTVEAAITAGIPRHHIRWGQTLGHIKIG